MAQREESFDCVVTASTAVATPLSIDVSFDPGDVVALEIVIPDGCAGLVGVALQVAHQQIIPHKKGRWYTGNDEVIRRKVEGYPNSGSWQVLAYNTDINDHVIEVRFSINEIPASTPDITTPVPLTTIASGGDLTPAGDDDATTAGDGGDLPIPLTPDDSGTDGGDVATPAPDVTDTPDAPATADPDTPVADAPDADVTPDASLDADPTLTDDGGIDPTLADVAPSDDGGDVSSPDSSPSAAAGRKSTAKPKKAPTVKKTTKKTAPKRTTKTVTVHGADKAIAWAKSRIGHYAENTGKNTGTELDELERLVGAHGEPWCAIFATTAVVHGGLPRSSRTAGVGTLDGWAQSGTNGYERGLHPVSAARHGDLVVRGSEHTGIVESNTGGVLVVIEGNTSQGMVERNTYHGAGPWTASIRPHYPNTTKTETVKRAPSKAPHKTTKKTTAKRKPAAKGGHKTTKKATAKRAPAKGSKTTAHATAPKRKPAAGSAHHTAAHPAPKAAPHAAPKPHTTTKPPPKRTPPHPAARPAPHAAAAPAARRAPAAAPPAPAHRAAPVPARKRR